MADLNFSSVTPRSHKEEVSSVGFPWRIFVIALVVFGLTLVLWAGMSFGYTPYIKSEIKKVEAELDTLSTTFDESQQKDFISFYSQLYNIRNTSVESVSLDTSRKAEAKDGGGTFFSLKIILNKKFLISS